MSTIFVDDISIVITDDGSTTTTVDLLAETAARIAADAAEAALRVAGDAAAIPLVQKGAPFGVATLDGGGLVPVSELPPLTLGATFFASSEAEMLASLAVPGDACIRTDLDPDGYFILRAAPPTVLSNWQQILSPGTVLSVDGRTGTVSLSDRYDPLGAKDRSPVRFGKAGTVAVAPGKAVEPVTNVETISSVWAYVKTPPSGLDMVLQLMKNGVAVVTLTILDGTQAVTVNTSVACAPGDVLTLDVVQVAPEGGWDLTVKVLFA